ncbi:hypothetical protein [Pedobacter cryoconitis]|uniref:Uncharacterized protein n=1 Tax=Pedobacter cryoconitis TaxID=188932 RepID=A0A7X0J6Q6_9SPHI|nr:hypothetical protein [Pedobacter cryoconitis]MBB6501654.1 hypothetical protein [Pedobacter cryoconitis]
MKSTRDGYHSYSDDLLMAHLVEEIVQDVFSDLWQKKQREKLITFILIY